jgi:hypothetical protein
MGFVWHIDLSFNLETTLAERKESRERSQQVICIARTSVVPLAGQGIHPSIFIHKSASSPDHIVLFPYQLGAVCQRMGHELCVAHVYAIYINNT